MKIKIAFPMVIILQVLMAVGMALSAVPFIGTFLTTGDISLAIEAAMNFLDKL